MTEHPEVLARLERKLDHLLQEVHRMAVDQATFDTDLAALVTAIGNLTAAVDAWVASHPDLSAEDTSVQDAAAAVAAELAKLTPAPAP